MLLGGPARACAACAFSYSERGRVALRVTACVRVRACAECTPPAGAHGSLVKDNATLCCGCGAHSGGGCGGTAAAAECDGGGAAATAAQPPQLGLGMPVAMSRVVSPAARASRVT